MPCHDERQERMGAARHQIVRVRLTCLSVSPYSTSAAPCGAQLSDLATALSLSIHAAASPNPYHTIALLFLFECMSAHSTSIRCTHSASHTAHCVMLEHSTEWQWVGVSGCKVDSFLTPHCWARD